MKSFAGVLMILLFVEQTSLAGDYRFKPERAVDPWKEPGLVPDKQTAIKIAEAVLFPIFGEETIKSQRPYEVTLAKGFWHVSGTLPKGGLGGVFLVVISHWDARIIHIQHQE